jgi:hypothetical protein
MAASAAQWLPPEKTVYHATLRAQAAEMGAGEQPGAMQTAMGRMDLRRCPALYIFTVSRAPSAKVDNSVFFETATGNRP